MKYVIDTNGTVVLGGPSSRIFHRDLFNVLGPESRIAGAGHCVIQNGRVIVSQGSVGFGIDAKPQDAEWIEAYLGMEKQTPFELEPFEKSLDKNSG